MTVPMARTSLEAHLYIDLTACECGETRLTTTSAVIELPAGGLATRFAGVCPTCGLAREFVLRLPDSPVPQVEDRVVYGVGGPSELIDAGQWVWAAERYASVVPARPAELAGDARRVARGRLNAAISAMEEAERFLVVAGDFPGPSDGMPDTAFWSTLGRTLREVSPGRFTRARLEAVRGAYEKACDSMGSRSAEALERIRSAEATRASRPARERDPVTGGYLDSVESALAAYQMIFYRLTAHFGERAGERDRRWAAAEAIRLSWQRERGWADWDAQRADPYEIPPADLPPAEPAWQMVGAARDAAGMDQRTGNFAA
jgi:hypothetical protein